MTLSRTREEELRALPRTDLLLGLWHLYLPSIEREMGMQTSPDVRLLLQEIEEALVIMDQLEELGEGVSWEVWDKVRFWRDILAEEGT